MKTDRPGNRFVFAFAATLILIAIASAPAFARVFTDQKGRKIDGEIVRVAGDDVEMKVGVKRFIFPIATLSQNDQDYVRKWAKENKTYRFQFDARTAEDTAKRRKAGTNKRKDVTRFSTWRYGAMISNQSGEPLKNLEVKYNLFIRNTKIYKDGNGTGRDKKETPAVQTGSIQIAQIDHSKRANFDTKWIEMKDREWQTSKKIQTRDSDGDLTTITIWDDHQEITELDGLWIKVYLDGKEIADWKSEGKMIKDAKWRG
ncbi:MAG: hypothetical protein HKN23_13330 [Verrucomicrobiales bacterium]|nr:hypothetical protein [Verrucomicrobiales bacterium]